MAQLLAPEVRLQFARRLKDMRTRRGFDRARYFAKSLGIEENRYTRYERAEVEPSLTLIHKMCATLGVSPNELLGFAEAGPQRPFDAAPGLAEPAAGSFAHTNGASEGGNALDAVSTLAWNLASEAVAMRSERMGRSKPAGGELMRDLEETSALFGKLRADPFRTVAEIVGDRALKGADTARRDNLAELIKSYTESISEPAERRRR
jgi:transcriptional regulator with XRE-family HTH domain